MIPPDSLESPASEPNRENQPWRTKPQTFSHLAGLFASLTDDLLQKPERLSLSQAAEKYRKLNNPGAYVGPWRNSVVPYMIEPMDVLPSRDFTGCIFVGPSQTAKTDALILNWLLYTVKVDPMDMIIFSPTMSVTKDFSHRRVDRLHRYSPEIGKLLLNDRTADNTFDKHYSSGIMVSLGWPSSSQFAGRPVGRIALTDYDRMPDDVDGDGSPYDLASKRTTTYGSFAMTLAESSPSRPVENPAWIPTTPHEAPPTTGILALYNRGDRRRLYWPCPHCEHFFEGNFKHLAWDDMPNIVDSAETVRMVCPSCSGEIHIDERRGMLAQSVWLKDGEVMDRGVKRGSGSRSSIASFWLNGVAAAFITWAGLVMTYLNSTREYQRTGSEEALKKFYNNDLGVPYIPAGVQTERLPEVLKSRAEALPEREVPSDVRFLIATVDVQKNMFVVQVFGILPGDPFDMVVIDRFQIIKSKRDDVDGDKIWVKPGAYLEDWDLITEQVINAKYPLSDGSGRVMQMRAVGCDSGGREGVTTNAYNYYRKLKAEGLSGRFHLLRGDNTLGIPRARIAFPDSNRRDRMAAARGDVPIIQLNSNMLKDTLQGRLESTTPGKGMVRFPAWLPDHFFVELCAETRTPKGWEATIRRRNEAWDLCYYAIGLCVSPVLRVEQIDWNSPPGWASPWATNDLIAATATEERFARRKTSSYDFKKLGNKLA
jgi:phage terminase large subunit GpA-like protein